ncbi:MAG: hypothetical protein HZB16_13600 [Armatimonadetes bacterium]|nr:hypothetical protein [Armatimonadota bacterium]
MAGLVVGQPAAAPAGGGKISLQAQGMPLPEALAKVVEQAGLKLAVVGTTLPTDKVDLVLREVTVTFALDQLLAGRGLEYQVFGPMLSIRPAANQPRPGGPPVGGIPTVGPTALPPAPTPAMNAALGALPKPVVDDMFALLRAAFDQPSDRKAAAAVGWRLRDLRPDWREALVRAMPGWWSSWDNSPAAALRGARLFAWLGESRPASTLAGEASRSAELRTQALVTLAELAVVSGDPGDAYSRLRQAGPEVDDQPKAAALAAVARYQLGDTGLAMTDATLAVTRWPNEACVLAAYGELLRQEGNAGGASVALQAALTRDAQDSDALYGTAALAAADGGDPSSIWESFVADEPFSLRSARVRLGVTTTARRQLWDRGGQIWDVSPAGDRVLYADNFHNQLQATDILGHGLATQLTDQETTKTWATWSPDEGHLAWVVGNALWLQKTNSSGAHKQIMTAEGDKTLRRTTWTPDGRLLLVTEQDLRARASRLRAYDLDAGAEVAPPAPFGQPGLGDAECLPDGTLLATLLSEERQAVVLLTPDGTLQLLRPWAPARTYAAPSLDATRRRVLYYDESSDTLMVAPTDGSYGTALPLTTASTGRGARGALFTPEGRSVALSAGGNTPTRLDLDGLTAPVTLRCVQLTNKAAGPEPPRLRFTCAEPRQDVTLALAVVDDDGREVGAAKLPLPSPAEYRPEVSTPGPHWVKATVLRGDIAETPRWYTYTVAPTN